jgi:hypothetical protein
MLNRIRWYLERLDRVKKGDEGRVTTQDIIRKRDELYSTMLDSNRKGKEIIEYRSWVMALDWVLGVKPEKGIIKK